MNKLRLSLEELTVDSFQTDEARIGSGTVEGYISTRCTGGALTCDDGATCVPAGATCDNATCYVSCNGSCPCYQTTDCGTDTGPVDTSAYTCSPCDVSVNEVGTCIAPC